MYAFEIVSVTVVSANEINMALELKWNDFEDSVQYSVALLNEMDGLVTRNTDDYKLAGLQVWTPEEVLNMLKDK